MTSIHVKMAYETYLVAEYCYLPIVMLWFFDKKTSKMFFIVHLQTVTHMFHYFVIQAIWVLYSSYIETGPAGGIAAQHIWWL